MAHDVSPQDPGQRERLPIVRIGVILCLLFGLYVWMNPSFLSRLSTLRSTSGRVIFLATFLLAWGALLACSVAPRAWAATALLFFGGNLLISTTYARVMGRSMSLNDAQNLREAMGSILDAIRQYGRTAGLVTLAIAALAGLLLWGRRSIRTRTPLPLVACSLATTLSYGTFLLRGGATSMLYFPANFESGLHALALTLEPLVRRSSGPEAPLPVEEVPLDPAVRNVVLVIDESIEAHVFHREATDHPIPDAVDLGIGYSFENNSAGSNLLLRRAADPRAVERSIHQFPSVFRLARDHGFRTAYLDAQGILSDADVQDYFEAKDKDFIDQLPPLSEYGSRPERDPNAERLLLDILGRGQRTFILVNKQGTHFPYAKNLPAEMAGLPDPYRTSVARTSVGFLARLAPKLPSGTLLLYTSDHGQNFKGRAPHNNAPGECTVSEWQVPIVVVHSSDMKPWADRIQRTWHDCADHGALAETLRNLLGARHPGQPSLLTPPTEELTQRHRAYYGSPKGLFGAPVLSLAIDKRKEAFLRE
ncbi:MAG TPA: sulfatase-like hydrolase/transferase [Holophagaceae bacterium]|nr:sulfatase-like hydrolase/transferase [Holophagaceae bacterium]